MTDKSQSKGTTWTGWSDFPWLLWLLDVPDIIRLEFFINKEERISLYSLF